MSCVPALNTLFFKGHRISIEFSEQVDRQSAQEAIFISPYVGQLEFEWSGTELEVSFTEELREQTTYVVTIGTDVADLRNRNRMAQAFTLAFSTGGEIDRGAIDGRVFPAGSGSPSGVMIFAYRLDGIKTDTLNPKTVRPDYITQSGKDGRFFFRHLGLGRYRVYGIRDQYRNLLYDPETDEFGIPAFDVSLTQDDTLRSDVTMKLAREDTTAPRLIRVTPLNQRLLQADFSEGIDTSSIHPARFLLTDTLGSNPLNILSAATSLPRYNQLWLVPSPQKKGAWYRLRATGLRDSAGITVSPLANTLDFESSSLSDSLPPAVTVFSIQDSSRDAPLLPQLNVYLTKPVRRVPWMQVMELRDSVGRVVPVSGQWLNDAALSLQPSTDLRSKEWYRLQVKTGRLKDYSENIGKDTTLICRFETMDAERLSSIEGAVKDLNQADARGRIYITATNIAQKNSRPTRIAIDKPGPFMIDKITEGQYTLEAFRDRNGNGALDPGTVFPYSGSERFAVYPDTLKLRARWPLEGVMMEIK